MKLKLKSRLPGEISITCNNQYAYDTTLMAESEEELKSLLMKVKEESEKAGFKLSIQRTKIMASDGETVRDFIFFSFFFFNRKVETLFSWAPKSLQTAAMKLKDACFLEEKL